MDAPRRLLMFCLIIQLGAIAIATGNRNIKDDETGSEMYPTPEVGTKNVTAHFCPFPCTFGNKTLCYPPPCPPPPCVDPARVKPTDCCVFCPNGPDCSSPDGGIIRYQHWKIVGNKNCTCVQFMQPAVCV